MKRSKVLIICIIAAIVILLIGMGIYFYTNKDEVSSNSDPKGEIVSIDFDKFKELVESNKKFVIVFSQDGCSHCKKLLENLEEVIAKNDVTIYNYDIKNIVEDEAEYVRELTNIKTVPLTLVFDEGEALEDYRLTGVKEYDEVVEMLEDASLIGKKDEKEDIKKEDEETKNESKPEKQLKKMGSTFYEDFYYDAVCSAYDDECGTFLEKFAEIGIKTNIDNLERTDVLNKFDFSYYDEKCNKYNTQAVIYPKSPYGKTDYNIKAILDCE